MSNDSNIGNSVSDSIHQLFGARMFGIIYIYIYLYYANIYIYICIMQIYIYMCQSIMYICVHINA